MSDGLQLIHSNGNGDPLPGGRDLHWVRVTSYAHPTPVNQLTDDGAYPHADCGEASIRSSLYDRKINADVLTIEHDAGATSQGTTAAALVRALHDLGLAATEGTGTLAPGVIMNPLGGRVFPVSDFGSYAAASADEFVSISTPGVWDTVSDMSAQAEAQIAEIWTALFVLFGQSGTRWNNLESMRRALTNGTGAAYTQGSEVPFVPHPVAPPTAVALTAVEAAQLAQVPAILALLTKIDAALHSA